MADAAGAKPFGLFERVLAGRYLRAKREHGGVALISIISFVGIMLAVAVLIITMSVMNGFRETLLGRILGVQGHIFIDTLGVPADERDVIARIARSVPGVEVVAPLVEGQALATANGAATGVLVKGMRREDLAQIDLVMKGLMGGEGIDGFRQDPDGVTGVFVGYRVAGQLGLRDGDPITLISSTGAATPFGTVPRRKSYPIVSEFNVGMSEADALIVYMPIEEAQLFFGRGDGVDRLELRLFDAERTEAVVEALRRVLPPGVGAYDWKAQNDALAGALEVERNVMRLILMMIVAIAAMNIISGLVMLVKNKSRDIAILRTMGATQGSILRVFFMAGAAVGVAGTLGGLILGVGVCLAIGPVQDVISGLIGRDVFPGEVYSLDQLPASVEWGEVALVTAWALAMSFLATLPPALRAARLDPVEALRYE